MDEILASIRKIIAEEPTPSENPTNHTPPAASGAGSTADGGAPPSADLSDILDEPTEHRATPTTAAAEQGLTEWSFSSSPTRGAAPAAVPASNPFSAQQADNGDASDTEAESPLVARLRDLATGGTGASSGDTATTPAAPSTPAEKSVETVSTITGSPGPSTPSVGPQNVAAPEQAKQDPAPVADPAPAANAVQDPVGKDTAVEDSLFGGGAASGRQPDSKSVEPVAAKTPSPADEKAAAPAPASMVGAETIAPGDSVDAAAVSMGVAESLAAIAAPAAPSEAADPLSDAGSKADALKDDAMVAVAEPLGSSSPDVTIADVLRPIVNQWLDENLPALIERAVEKKLAERS